MGVCGRVLIKQLVFKKSKQNRTCFYVYFSINFGKVIDTYNRHHNPDIEFSISPKIPLCTFQVSLP